MKKIKICLIILFFTFFLPANPVSARLLSLNIKNAPGLIGKTGSGLPQASVSDVIAGAIQAVLGLVGVAFFILFLYGGFVWMTAKGNEDQVKKARKILINATIGLAIVILAYSITYFIISALEAQPSPT